MEHCIGARTLLDTLIRMSHSQVQLHWIVHLKYGLIDDQYRCWLHTSEKKHILPSDDVFSQKVLVSSFFSLGLDDAVAFDYLAGGISKMREVAQSHLVDTKIKYMEKGLKGEETHQEPWKQKQLYFVDKASLYFVNRVSCINEVFDNHAKGDIAELAKVFAWLVTCRGESFRMVQGIFVESNSLRQADGKAIELPDNWRLDEHTFVSGNGVNVSC